MTSFKDHRVTTNITIQETACQCECGMGFYPGKASDTTISNIYLLAQNIQILINHLQVFYYFPQYTKFYVKINSWCRCSVHNKNEGGSTHSKHMTGGAADIVIYYIGDQGRVYIPPKTICRAAFLLNIPKITTFGAIGCYHNRVHLDIREGDMVTWFKKDKDKFPDGSKYLYGVGFTEDIKLV